MKPLIAGLAMIIIALLMLIFQIDNYNCRLQTEFLKHCADEASNSASLFFDKDEFAQGSKIFIEEEGVKAIELILKTWLKLKDNLPGDRFKPEKESYWRDNISYTAYFFDDDGICEVYVNGKWARNFNFTYDVDTKTRHPYIEESPDYPINVRKANVVVIINAGRANYKLFLNPKPTIRLSGYEYEI